MSQFSVTITTDNAAFGEDLGGEVARLLRAIADRAECGIAEHRPFVLPVRDANGNTVGEFSFIPSK